MFKIVHFQFRSCFILLFVVFFSFLLVQDHVSLKNNVLQKHLTTVESIALQRGLPPEGFDVLLNVALSGKLGKIFIYC